jgi:hypothetical protein
VWFGVTHIHGEDCVLVAIYRADGSRVMRVGAPLDQLPSMIRMLRGASDGAVRGRPRCRECGSDYGVPDLDGSPSPEEQCAST